MSVLFCFVFLFAVLNIIKSSSLQSLQIYQHCKRCSFFLSSSSSSLVKNLRERFFTSNESNGFVLAVHFIQHKELINATNTFADICTQIQCMFLCCCFFLTIKAVLFFFSFFLGRGAVIIRWKWLRVKVELRRWRKYIWREILCWMKREKK